MNMPGGIASWDSQSQAEALTLTERAMLDAIMDRLQPGDVQQGIPSASQAGAARYVSLLLGRDPPVYYEVPTWRTLYPQAIAALDQVAEARFGTSLDKLKGQDLDQLLRDLQAGALTGPSFPAAQPLIFKTFLKHCYQGCFGDPRWGGNQQAKMWEAIGYPLRPAER
ncbi:MAG: gluconate 2-dehydrogenase subunit 3 family protein [Mesorhizobium sp.]|nr:MAG: gluconate 2-dehydrogenase subunit 3 family protein [Mesorhizobium sp.]